MMAMMCRLVVVVNVGWTNRKYVHLSFSSMNFRSNNWMIRDLETKCTKTRTQSNTVWCTTYLVFSLHRASCMCVWMIRFKHWPACERDQSQCIHCRLCIYLSTSTRHAVHGPKIVVSHSFVLWRIDSILRIDWNVPLEPNQAECDGCWMRVILMTSFIICMRSEMTLTRIDNRHDVVCMQAMRVACMSSSSISALARCTRLWNNTLTYFVYN